MIHCAKDWEQRILRVGHLESQMEHQDFLLRTVGHQEALLLASHKILGALSRPRLLISRK